ncbi:MAG: hypothetical protein ACRCZ0_09055 [Cetobacterium sp.]
MNKLNKRKLESEKIRNNLNLELKKIQKKSDLSSDKIENKSDLEKQKEENMKNSFEGLNEVIDFIDYLSKKNNITIDTIGRESFEKIKDEEIGSFYCHILGNEKDIFNFIIQLEKSKKFICFKENSIMMEKNNETIDLKVNVMYIINNKIQKIDYFYYNDNSFESVIIRNLSGKRRQI